MNTAQLDAKVLTTKTATAAEIIASDFIDSAKSNPQDTVHHFPTLEAAVDFFIRILDDADGAGASEYAKLTADAARCTSAAEVMSVLHGISDFNA